MRAAIAWTMFAALLLGAAGDKPAKLPADVQAVVDLAMAAPPEFAADAILRLIRAGRIADKDPATGREWKREYLEIAFHLAARAQNPFRMTLIAGYGADTRAAYRASALRMKLDALSLQVRSIESMLAVDKAAARDLFSQMVHPAVEPLTCEAALIPDVSPYYELLGRMAQESFSESDRRKNEHVNFLVAQLDRMSSQVELPPAARAIAAGEWSPAQFEIVSGAFLAHMQALGADDRAFSSSVRDLDEAIGELIARARQNNAHPERIAEAYRSYLVANYSAARCADNAALRLRQVSDEKLELFGDAIRGDLAALTPDETRPKKVEGEARPEPYWQSSEAKRIFQECLRLRTGADGRYLPDAARNTREWKRQLNDFLAGLATWKPNDEKSEADYFHQKAIVFEALLELTPAGDERNRVLDDYLSFLKSSNLQQQSPTEWYWHAHSSLNRLRTGQPAEGARLLAAFAASGNIILTLEAALERLDPEYSMFPR